MDLSELSALVDDGKIFSVEFIKRSDGSSRRMLARTGVRTSGAGERSYDPERHNLLLVWDMQARGYRTVPADGVLRLRAHGRETVTELAKGRRGG